MQTKFEEDFFKMLTPPTRKWFTLTVPDERLRRMSRAEYYEVRHYLRTVERKMWESLRG